MGESHEVCPPPRPWGIPNRMKCRSRRTRRSDPKWLWEKVGIAFDCKMPGPNAIHESEARKMTRNLIMVCLQMPVVSLWQLLHKMVSWTHFTANWVGTFLHVDHTLKAR